MRLSWGSISPRPFASSDDVRHTNLDIMIQETNQQGLTAVQKEAVVRALSQPRLSTYLNAAGHDWDKAWQLYIWNARIGEAFHLLIQTVEVGIRNCTDQLLVSKYGPQWGTHDQFIEILDPEQCKDLELVKKRIKNRQLPLVNGQIVAGLSFGFWVGLLHKRYNVEIWSGDNLRIAFSNLPDGKTRKVVFKRCAEVLLLRNRISHHEPIINRDISLDYSNAVELIRWICPVTCDLVRPPL